MSLKQNPLITFPTRIQFPLRSGWANEPINLDAPFQNGAWEESGKMKFPKGWIMAKNDAKFLYLAIDVIEDYGDDPGTGDYFWLSFDNDRNRSITANRDVNYGLYPHQPNRIGLSYYLGPSRWTVLQNTPSLSEVRAEFGPSEHSPTYHRIWKFKIDLLEINVSLARPLGVPHTFFGLRVKSSNPVFTEDFPSNFFQDFSGLQQLIFSRKPSIPSRDLGRIIGSIGLIPYNKIRSGRATTDRGYYLKVDNAAFGGTLNLIGNGATLEGFWAAGKRKYKVEIQPAGESSYSTLISSWNNYAWNGSEYVLEPFHLNGDGFYELPDPDRDFSIDDLLIQFPTHSLPKGLTNIKVIFYNRSGVSEHGDRHEIMLYIDNHLPSAIIENIRHGDNEVSACAIETIGPGTDGLNFNITANDPEGNLLAVDFTATFGDSGSTSIIRETYTQDKGNWAGFSNRLFPPSGNWRPGQSCAYSFIIEASARTTNGYKYIGKNQSHRNLTLLLS